MEKENKEKVLDERQQEQQVFSTFSRRSYGDIVSIDIDRKFIVKSLKAAMHAEMAAGNLGNDDAEKVYYENVITFFKELIKVIEV